MHHGCVRIREVRDFELGADGLLRFKDRLCIPADAELKRMILEEGHKSRLNLHPGMTKRYQELKESFGEHNSICSYMCNMSES